MKKQLLFIGSMLIVLTLGAFTYASYNNHHEGTCHKKRHHDFDEFKKSKHYAQLLKYRAEFDEQLSESEKVTIDEYRPIFKEKMEQWKSKNKKEMEDWSKEDFKSKKEQFKQEFAPVFEIAKAHKDELIEIKKKAMKEFGHDFKMKHKRKKRIKRSYHEEPNSHADEKNCHSDGQDKHIKRHHRKKHHHKMMAIHFLLMDPSEASISETEEFEFSTYPNPATDYVNVKFEAKKEGEVKIYINNDKGLIIKELNTSTLSKGEFNKKFSLVGLPESSMYFITVETPSGTASKKLILNKQ